jgi:hypothetical protein
MLGRMRAISREDAAQVRAAAAKRDEPPRGQHGPTADYGDDEL